MRYDWLSFQFRNGGSSGARTAFEQVCAEAIARQNPTCQVTVVRPDPGDNGIDFYFASEGTGSEQPEIHAFQCKFFIDTIGKSQKEQICDSLKKAVNYNRFKLLTYTFMLPKEFSHDEQSWWNGFAQKAKKDHNLDVKLLKGDSILNIGRDHNLLAHWFHEEAPTPIVGTARPLGTLLPPSIGKRYVESTARLSSLAKHFGSPRTRTDIHLQPLVLAGPPGIGKTRLAIEYAHENHTAYNTQIKLPIDTKANLHSAIVNLSTDPRLAVTFQPLADRDLIYQIVLAQLASLCADGLLLILDGANSQESVSVVRDFLKLLGAAHVIVTSQIRKWGIGFEVVEVTPLTVAGAASFLFNGMQASRITQSDAEQLAQELGCVPLAIEIALAYCDENLCRASEYLDLLKKKTDEILQFKEMYGTVEYPFSLWAALAAAWDRVVEIDPWANTILVISAFYGQAPIPLFFWEYEEIVAECSKFLVDLRATTAFQTLMAAYGQPQPRKSIAILQRYCHVDLSTEDGLECYSVPSLIRTALRGRYAKDSLSLAIMLTQPLNALQKHLLIDEQSPSTWTVWSFLRPHVESVLSDLVNSKFVWPTVLLAERLGSWYSACGFNQRAIAILSQVYSMEVEAWGSGPSDWQELAMFGEPDHATIFVMHSCTFSRVLLKGSSISEAKAVLQMCEQLLPRVGPRLQARWYAHTGDCLFAEGEISDAGKMYTEAIEIEGKLNESQNGLTMGVYLQKRASTQIAMSEFEKAESIIRESIQICAKWRFTRHRATVVGSDLTNSRVLSSVYLEDDWQITSDQDRRVMFSVPRWLGGGYGRFTPELAHVLSTFGDLRVAQDRLDEARLLFDGSLAICWYSFGPLASLTAEVWAKRKVISTDGEQFADSYPDWVCGMIVTEIQLISNGVRRRRARRG